MHPHGSLLPPTTVEATNDSPRNPRFSVVARQSNFKRPQTGLPDFGHWEISANPDDKFLGPVVATIYSKSCVRKTICSVPF